MNIHTITFCTYMYVHVYINKEPFRSVEIRRDNFELNVLFANIYKSYGKKDFKLTENKWLQPYLLQTFLVDGHWSVWTHFSACSVTCGDGTTTRRRTCSNPAPLHGGRSCMGNDTETITCKKTQCPGSSIIM